MSASIDFLPIWKKDATPCERLQEFAEMARKNPERWEKLVIGCVETKSNGHYQFRNYFYGCLLTEAVGLHEISKSELIKASEK